MSQLYSNIHHDNKVVCDIYHFTRQKKLLYHTITSKASSCFELIHFDIWGPLTINLIHDHKYFLTVRNDFSIYFWIIFLKSKAEIKFIRIDNDSELLISHFYMTNDIIHQRSCTESPHQN